MIRTVFFDFYGTLVKWAPDAEQIQQQACAAEGIDLSRTAIERAYPTANEFLNAENAKQPIPERSEDDRNEFFTEYELLLLTTAGLSVPRETARRIWHRVHSTPKSLALYDDALPALHDLHAEGFTIGVISNMGPELGNILASLGLADTVSVWASSGEAGVNKPHPGIFHLALSKAGAQPHETLHVGDSYSADVVGAQNANVRPLLIWREPFGEPPNGVPVVRTLTQIKDMLRENGFDPASRA